MYEFENNGSEYYKEIITAFNKIAQSKRIWSLISSEKFLSDYQKKLMRGLVVWSTGPQHQLVQVNYLG